VVPSDARFSGFFEGAGYDISDVQLRRDGLEVLRWLRSEGPRHVPAIAVSGNGPGRGMLYTKASDVAGADVSLAKPVAKRELLAAVGRLIADGRPPADAAGGN
jgi:CheY-like chemotaxis protein